jgi:hypothetical protein
MVRTSSHAGYVGEDYVLSEGFSFRLLLQPIDTNEFNCRCVSGCAIVILEWNLSCSHNAFIFFVFELTSLAWFFVSFKNGGTVEIVSLLSWLWGGLTSACFLQPPIFI